MKAFFLEDYGRTGIRDIPKPELKPGSALIRIQSVSICGSDISAYRKKGVPATVPLILGHEIAGVIEEIYAGASTELKPGDRVILDPYLYCGHCYPCSLGRTNCCETLKVLGVRNVDGAMSEYFVHPVKNLVKLGDSLPWDVAPIAEPLTISLHALHRTQLKAGEKAVIIGAGPIGLLAAMAAKVYGAEPILVDIIPSRLSYARQLGIPLTVNPAVCDPVAQIAELTGGRMAEVVVEASGSNAAIQQTLDYASYCGRIALTGWPTGETALTTSTITRKEINLYGSRTSVGEFEEAIALIESGQVDARAVLTEVVPFDRLPEMMRNMSEHPEKYLKVVALLE